MNEKENNLLEHEESRININFTSKEVMDVTYKGRVARFGGELGLHEFMADIDSARWLCPKEGTKMTQREKEEVISAVCKHYHHKKIRVFFCDKNHNVIYSTR